MLHRRVRAFEDYCLNVGAGLEALPEAFRLLRHCVDSDHAALFQCDHDGRFCGAFHEVALHAPQAREFIQQADNGADRAVVANLPAALDLFRLRAPVQLLRFDDAATRATPLYRDVIGPIGGREVLRIGLLSPKGPLGLIALVRGKGARGFSSHDAQNLLKLGRAWRRLLHNVDPERPELVEEGFVVISADLQIERADPIGRSLWNQMHDARFLPLPDTAALLYELTGTGSVRCLRGSGTFELSRIALTPWSTAKASTSTLVRLRKLVQPRIHQLTLMDRHGLSSMQKMVCLDLLRGRTAAEIAVDQGIAVRTVLSHTGEIYRKLDVRDRAELVASFCIARG